MLYTPKLCIICIERRGGLGHLHTVNGVLNTEVLLVKMTRGSQQIVQEKNKDFF